MNMSEGPYPDGPHDPYAGMSWLEKRSFKKWEQEHAAIALAGTFPGMEKAGANVLGGYEWLDEDDMKRRQKKLRRDERELAKEFEREKKWTEKELKRREKEAEAEWMAEEKKYVEKMANERREEQNHMREFMR